jgi:hypothetical protein
MRSNISVGCMWLKKLGDLHVQKLSHPRPHLPGYRSRYGSTAKWLAYFRSMESQAGSSPIHSARSGREKCISFNKIYPVEFLGAVIPCVILTPISICGFKLLTPLRETGQLLGLGQSVQVAGTVRVVQSYFKVISEHPKHAPEEPQLDVGFLCAFLTENVLPQLPETKRLLECDLPHVPGHPARPPFNAKPSPKSPTVNCILILSSLIATPSHTPTYDHLSTFDCTKRWCTITLSTPASYKIYNRVLLRSSRTNSNSQTRPFYNRLLRRTNNRLLSRTNNRHFRHTNQRHIQCRNKGSLRVLCSSKDTIQRKIKDMGNHKPRRFKHKRQYSNQG